MNQNYLSVYLPSIGVIGTAIVCFIFQEITIGLVLIILAILLIILLGKNIIWEVKKKMTISKNKRCGKRKRGKDED
jgi:cytochrome bd-type quinol oxidase subunit 1